MMPTHLINEITPAETAVWDALLEATHQHGIRCAQIFRDHGEPASWLAVFAELIYAVADANGAMPDIDWLYEAYAVAVEAFEQRLIDDKFTDITTNFNTEGQQ